MEVTDINVVRLCTEGDTAARALVYRRYSPRMWRLALRYVGDESVAWDVLHDVFLVAFTQMKTLRRAESLEPWLMQLTRNAALLYLRTKERRQQIFVETDGEDLFGPSNDDETATAHVASLNALADAPSDFSESQPDLDDLLRLIEELPAGYRAVFKLAVLDGLTHEEVAQQLGISPHSSSSQLLRARRLLMRWIADGRLRTALLLLLCAVPTGLFLLHLGRKSDTKPSAVAVKEDEKQRTNATGNPSAHTSSEGESAGKTEKIDAPNPHSPQSRPSHQRPIAHRLPTTPYYITPPADTLAPPAPSADTLKHVIDVATRTDSMTLRREDKPSLPVAPSPFNKAIADESLKTLRTSSSPWQLTAWVSGQASASESNPASYQLRNNSATSGVEDIFFKATTWEAVNAYFRNNAAASPEEQALAEVGILNSGEIREQVHHRPTFTVALNISHRLTDRWSVGAGLSYSLQHSNFVRGGNAANFKTRQTIHDLGFTLRSEYFFFRPATNTSLPSALRRFSASAAFDATLYVPLRATRTYSVTTPTASRTVGSEHPHVPLSFSPAFSLGLHYRLAPHVDFTVAPALRYNVAPSSYPTTIRTAHPFSFSLPIGFTLEF